MANNFDELPKFVIICKPLSDLLLEHEDYLDFCHPIYSEDWIRAYGYGSYFVEVEWYQEHIIKKFIVS